MDEHDWWAIIRQHIWYVLGPISSVCSSIASMYNNHQDTRSKISKRDWFRFSWNGLAVGIAVTSALAWKFGSTPLILCFCIFAGYNAPAFLKGGNDLVRRWFRRVFNTPSNNDEPQGKA